MATYLGVEDIWPAVHTTLEGTTSAIISVVKRFICALMEMPRLQELEFPEPLSSGCASFVNAALRFNRKIKCQAIFSHYELHCYQSGDTAATSYVRFVGKSLQSDQVKIVYSVSLGLAVLEADLNGKPPKVHFLRGVEVAIEQDFMPLAREQRQRRNRRQRHNKEKRKAGMEGGR